MFNFDSVYIAAASRPKIFKGSECGLGESGYPKYASKEEPDLARVYEKMNSLIEKTYYS